MSSLRLRRFGRTWSSEVRRTCFRRRAPLLSGGTPMDPNVVAERRVGTTLRGKWRLEKLIGVGGMAAVYVGVHTIGQRQAIKILHPDVARSPEQRARFEREAHAVNRLKHPGAVEIRDIDVAEDGAPFLVMELLEGESLGERNARLGGIGTDELLRWMDELLDVLVDAHAKGIIHRDIKLDNLFVQRDGHLKVLDFGIARMRDGEKGDMRTRTGAALGTVPYMAPEQIKGADVDARVDLFAVGATMFRLIAQRRVHEADTEAMLIIKMATEAAPPLASVAPLAVPGLCLVVDRALQFDRAQRYPDASTMQRDVQALRAGTPPPYASTLARGGPAALAIERTVAAAPPAPSPASVDATFPAVHAAAPARAAWSAAALEPTQQAGPAGFEAPSSVVAVSARPASLAASPTPAPWTTDERKVLAIVLAALGASLLLLVVIALVRKDGGRTSSGANDKPAAVDPDDPSWRPSPANRPGAMPTEAPRPRKRHGHGHGHDDDDD
ncbi:Serine/threonine protein kinase PknB [Minicystis rosea]|nr:Serine/threonine protein kinase PknB [Minicystis rosea]